jgi:hypothetical protein
MKKLMIVPIALALLSALAMPTSAAEKSEVSFGGFVSFETWVMDEDEAMLDLDNDGSWDDGRYDDTDTMWTLDACGSRFNATFKRENFKGFVEVRPRTDRGNTVQVRHWYAEWNFGPGFLLLGQTTRPVYNSISSSAAQCTANFSMTYGGDTRPDCTRYPMIRLHFPFSVGQFQLAFLDPSRADIEDAFGGTEDDVDTTLPMIEADLDFSFGPLSLTAFGGWHEYEEVYRNQDGDNTLDEIEFDIESWIVGANAKFLAGPFRLAVGGWTGENTVAGVDWFRNDDRTILEPVIFDGNGDGLLDGVHDTDDWGVYIDVSFKLNKMVKFAAGGGTIEQDRSDDQIGANNGDELENECTRWYVNSTITVAEGFTITPEIGDVDYGTSIMDGGESLDQGDMLYYGVWWKMVF